MGAAVPLLMAAGPPVPAVPAVSFEPERLHPTVPPASAAINTAVITFLSTGSIILSSRVGRVVRFIVGKKRNHFDEMCGRRSLQARTQKNLTTIRMRTRHGDKTRPFAALVQLAITCKNGQRSSAMRVAASIGFTARLPAHARTGRHIA
ncbi:hypothetical protein ACTJLB_23840 [Paraburkholderia sp. 22098]